MKKIVCALLALLILLGVVPALGETTDWTGVSDDQLQEALKNGETYMEQLTELLQQLEEEMGKMETEQERRTNPTSEPVQTGGFQHTPVTVKRSPDKYTWYI